MRRGRDDRRFQLWQCKTCEADLGVASSVTTEILHTVMVDIATGKPDRRRAGRKLVCALCLGRGEITPVI